MNASTPEELARFAEELARAAAPLILEPVDPEDIRRKADTTLVTATDHAVQAMMVRAIRERYPDHAVVGEEGDDLLGRVRPTDARYCWVIDPLDGTRNYAGGLPCCSSSIGLLDDGVPVAGVVLEPNVGRLYRAVTGRGTTCNGEPVAVRDVPQGYSSLVGVTSNQDATSLAVVRGLLEARGVVLRNMGSTAYHLALASCGAFGAMFTRKCKLWDIAAGVLLVTEAGGRVTGLDGSSMARFDLSRDSKENLPILAGAPRTHEYLLGLVHDFLAEGDES